MVDTTEMQDIEAYTDKETTGTSLGDLLSKLKL